MEKSRTELIDVTEESYERLSLEVATEGLKALRAYLVHQGRNENGLDRWLRDKAKAGAVAVGGYTRIYAAKTNRESVQIAAAKAGLLDKADVRRLKA